MVVDYWANSEAETITAPLKSLPESNILELTTWTTPLQAVRRGVKLVLKRDAMVIRLARSNAGRLRVNVSDHCDRTPEQGGRPAKILHRWMT
jgi:hypothetical protein